MEEYIGYGLVILVLATVIFLFKKLFVGFFYFPGCIARGASVDINLE